MWTLGAIFPVVLAPYAPVVMPRARSLPRPYWEIVQLGEGMKLLIPNEPLLPSMV